MEVERLESERVDFCGEGPCGQELKAQARDSQNELKPAAQCECPPKGQLSESIGKWEKAGHDSTPIDKIMEAYRSYRPGVRFL
jgi:hypothetical protein